MGICKYGSIVYIVNANLGAIITHQLFSYGHTCFYILFSLSPIFHININRTYIAHAEQDILEGKTRGIIPVVIWEDGGFLLVESAEEGERTYDIGIVDSRPKFEEDLGFEPIPDEEDAPVKKE